MSVEGSQHFIQLLCTIFVKATVGARAPERAWQTMCGCCASRSQRKRGRKQKKKSKPKAKPKAKKKPHFESKEVYEPTKFKLEKEDQNKLKAREYKERDSYLYDDEDEEEIVEKKVKKTKPSQVTTTREGDIGIFDCCLCCMQPGTSSGIITVNERPHEKERRERLNQEYKN
uniref:Uncharacterized protein n=1 Tax=Glossina brevipalpis TaxID=37001 RepID=A0A1A9WEE8_9MUSC